MSHYVACHMTAFMCLFIDQNRNKILNKGKRKIKLRKIKINKLKSK